MRKAYITVLGASLAGSAATLAVVRAAEGRVSHDVLAFGTWLLQELRLAGCGGACRVGDATVSPLVFGTVLIAQQL